MSSAESTVHDSNIELLRIILISMILCLHYFKYSGTLHTLKPSDLNYYPAFWLESLFIVAADCFVLITGYYQINEKFKLKKVIELWKQVIFYSVAISLIFWFGGIEPVTIPTMLQAFFPVITGTYWFVTTYSILYQFCPFQLSTPWEGYMAAPARTTEINTIDNADSIISPYLSFFKS
jgi:hypothetical protein